jgi:hypothetical protein
MHEEFVSPASFFPLGLYLDFLGADGSEFFPLMLRFFPRDRVAPSVSFLAWSFSSCSESAVGSLYSVLALFNR